MCLVQKQWIHSSTSRAWRSESNHMKRPHIKEGTSSNWGRIRRTSLLANEVLVKQKHFSERLLHLLSYTTVCFQPRKKKIISKFSARSRKRKVIFLCVIFSSPSLVCYVSDNILPASSGSSCVIKALYEHMLSERKGSCAVRNESETDVSSLSPPAV